MTPLEIAVQTQRDYEAGRATKAQAEAAWEAAFEEDDRGLRRG